MSLLRSLAWLLALTVCGSARADRFVVRNANNGGTDSLRWAIGRANAHAGRDKIVFARGMAGKIVMPLNELPIVTDHQTIINGDIDGDGAPDVQLNGNRQLTGDGLMIQGARRCTVAGLSVAGFPDDGIAFAGADYARVRSCHLGVNLDGSAAVANGLASLRLTGCSFALVGGPSPGDRNIIAAGRQPERASAGIYVIDGHDNVIIGNHLGITRDGMGPLGLGFIGVRLEGGAANLCRDNRIGGPLPEERNIFGGAAAGLLVDNAGRNTVSGNLFGLAADGEGLVPLGQVGVALRGAENTVGGRTRGARNVFAGGFVGISISLPASVGNKIQGNYFGTNAAGTAQRRLRGGVLLEAGAGPQLVGGGTVRAGNYFTAKSPESTVGVLLSEAGDGTTIRHNTFGVLPSGRDASVMDVGVDINSRRLVISGDAPRVALAATRLRVEIADSVFARAQKGVRSHGSGSRARVVRNTFRQCEVGVSIDDDATAHLGDLGNSSTRDDGGNLFRRSNTWHIRNETPWPVKAEGNDFSTTARAQINAKIWDRRDDGSLGRVDFVPLAGGLLPTGETSGLMLTGAAARGIPRGGAQITFTLSSVAQVQARVLNIAGRPVRTICRATDCEAGANTLIWNAQSDRGLPVPNGTYLVELTARADDGAQARALTQVILSR